MATHFKIIQNDDVAYPVLIFRDKYEDTLLDYVRIITYVEDDGVPLMYETSCDMDASMISNYIDDFSTKSAMDFLNNFVKP